MRTVFAVLAVVGLGLVAVTHHRTTSAQTVPSSEERESPGESAGLRPAAPSGKSQAPNDAPVTVTRVYTKTHEMRVRQSLARLSFLDHCVHADCPGFKVSEAWSYDVDVNKQLAQEINEYATLAGSTPEAEKAARYFLANGNDDVREAALQLLAQAEVSRESMQSVFGAMAQTTSSPLMKQFLKSKFAAACGDEAYANLCIAWIKDRMLHGGENVQKALARYSLEITNEYTAPLLAKYERIEAKRDPFSLKTRYLRANNAEFGRLQRNGG